MNLEILENNIKLFEERLGEKSNVLNKIDEKLFTRLPERKIRKNMVFWSCTLSMICAIK